MITSARLIFLKCAGNNSIISTGGWDMLSTLRRAACLYASCLENWHGAKDTEANQKKILQKSPSNKMSVCRKSLTLASYSQSSLCQFWRRPDVKKHSLLKKIYIPHRAIQTKSTITDFAYTPPDFFATTIGLRRHLKIHGWIQNEIVVQIRRTM